ncbi:hypothetical protein BGZ65_012677 [Modicella reniformis]|uniref:F-box domain-containing protein n=1 Tax=Modicella reniformis TaxID=1440133 RepID=A0A9P6MK81_9FUNG|nr:hypothetical protein BGZ65_012677 [Modicella reniformis]
MDGVKETAAVIQKSTISRATIFDIHHICTEICHHLSRRDIRRCTLVSREFRAAFLPYIWRDISIIRRSTVNRFRQSDFQAALTQYARYVESITTVYIDAWPLIYNTATTTDASKSNCDLPAVDCTTPGTSGGDNDTTITTTITTTGELLENPQRRVFPNLRVINSLVLQSRPCNIQRNLAKMRLILPILDGTVAPKLESVKIEHVDFNQTLVLLEFMARIQQLELRELRIGPRTWSISCQMLRRILECLSKIEIFSFDILVFHYWRSTESAEQESAAWESEEGSPHSEITTTIISSTTTITTTTTTTSIIPESEEVDSIVWRLPLKLPDRFAMKDLDFVVMNCDNELDSIVAFLSRCPDIERLVVPPVLLISQTFQRLTDLLLNWIHLREMTIVQFYLTDHMLSEVMKAACRNLRHHRHHQQHLDSEQVDGPMESQGTTGPGLKSLHIWHGSESFPGTCQTIVEFHGATLVCLTLVGSRVVNGTDLQQLLCSCPNLEVLEAMSTLDKDRYTRSTAGDPILSTEDMLTVSGPIPTTSSRDKNDDDDDDDDDNVLVLPPEMGEWGWVCTRLRVLKLRYLPRETKMGWETGISLELVEQLGRMRYLEDLRLGRMTGLRLCLGTLSDSVLLKKIIDTSSSTSGSIPYFDSRLGFRRRTESITSALRIMSRRLNNLKKLELRGLKEYVDRDEVKNARRAWKQIEWIHFSQ